MLKPFCKNDVFLLRVSEDPKGLQALMDSQDLQDPREPGEKLDNLDLLDNQETEESQVVYFNARRGV